MPGTPRVGSKRCGVVLDDEANGAFRDAGDSQVEVPCPAQLDRERSHGLSVKEGSRKG